MIAKRLIGPQSNDQVKLRESAVGNEQFNQIR